MHSQLGVTPQERCISHEPKSNYPALVHIIQLKITAILHNMMGKMGHSIPASSGGQMHEYVRASLQPHTPQMDVGEC